MIVRNQLGNPSRPVVWQKKYVSPSSTTMINVRNLYISVSWWRFMLKLNSCDRLLYWHCSCKAHNMLHRLSQSYFHWNQTHAFGKGGAHFGGDYYGASDILASAAVFSSTQPSAVAAGTHEKYYGMELNWTVGAVSTTELPSSSHSSVAGAGPSAGFPGKNVIIPLYALIFILSIVGNLLVIVTLIRNRRMRTVTNVFLLNLVSTAIIFPVHVSNEKASNSGDSWQYFLTFRISLLWQLGYHLQSIMSRQFLSFVGVQSMFELGFK